MTEKPGWSVRSILARIGRARRFPENTCPCSRHAQMIGEAMAGKHGKQYAEMLAAEPEGRVHIATSLLITVEQLFKARNEIARLKARKP